MKGHIVKRGKTWSIVVELGKDTDGNRRQKWYTVKGSKADAQRELRTILKQLDDGAYVSPHRQSVEDFCTTGLPLLNSTLIAAPLSATKIFVTAI